MIDKPIPLHPFDPIPWETFTPISSDYTRTRAPMTLYAFGLLGILAVIGGILWAVNQ